MSKNKSTTINIAKKTYENVVSKSYSLLEDICSLIDNKINNKRIRQYITKKLNISNIKSLKFDNSILEVSNNDEKFSIKFIPNINKVQNIIIRYNSEILEEEKIISFENDLIKLREKRTILNKNNKEISESYRIYKDNILVYKKYITSNIVNNKKSTVEHEAFINEDIISAKRLEINSENKTIARFFKYRDTLKATFYDDKTFSNEAYEELLFIAIEQEGNLCQKRAFDLEKSNWYKNLVTKEDKKILKKTRKI